VDINMAGLFDLVKKSNEDYFMQGRLADRYTEQDIRDYNISQTPAYLQGVEKINPIYSNVVNGRFYPSVPNAIDVAVNAKNPIKTTGHEAYHLQSLNYSDFLNSSNTKATPQNQHSNPYNWNILPPIYGKRDIQIFQDRVKNAYDTYKDKYSLGGEFAYKPYETMADLQGIEATLPSGKTILDTDIGKDLYKTKEEKQYYLKASLPGVMKALEYDPSLWEIAKDRADYAARVFKDKATASSYAKAAADAFKAFMSGPEAKVEYQDPFGDTTK